ncbi:uncharacterized protein RJT21DRAFT_122400 [Scheffersomyces amazonensis]|uniref:uncharacterized protein n=1 Tax=Scheffersomyces amazonensis TaxID=1078765 RepID=UPI00315D3D83
MANKNGNKPKDLVTQEQITTHEALNLFKNTLNFNVISRYDPAIKQLLWTTSHCVVYNFNDESQDWVKSDYQGTLALYLRDYKLPTKDHIPDYQDLQNLFCYGLILLNRNNPECFSLGLVPNKVSQHFYPNGLNNSQVKEMAIELNDNLIIIKNLLDEIYGLWVYNEEDRAKLYKLLEYSLNINNTVVQ